jgi:hypothetical protein
MKDSAWDNKLWQNKMQELPLKGDVNAAWLNMQTLLDENMPAGQSVAGKNAGRILKNSVISVISVIIIATLLYSTVKLISGGHHPKNNNEKHKTIQRDSNSAASETPGKNNLTPGKGNLTGSTANLTDSAGAKNHNSSTGIKPDRLDSKDFTAAGARGSTPGNKSGKNFAAKTNSSTALITPGGNTSPLTMPKRKNSGHRGHVQSSLHKRMASSTKSNIANNLSQGSNNTQLLPGSQQNLAVDSVTSKQTGNNTIAGSNSIKSAADSVTSLLTGNLNAKTKSVVSPVVQPDSTAKKSNAAKTAPPQKTNKVKPKPAATSNSKFELAIKIGANSNGSFTAKNQNSNFYGSSKPDVFAGVSAAYYINPKISLGIGINILSPKIISGSSSFTNYSYVTVNDTGKKTTHLIGKATVNSTRKLYSVDIPVIARYRLNNFISFNAGPVISLPVKQLPVKNSLSNLSAPVDSTGSVYLKNYVNSAAINNKLNFSLSGGVRVNVNRFFIDGAYMQNITPYTITTSFGSGKIYYHTFQFGVGFLLFKPKNISGK